MIAFTSDDFGRLGNQMFQYAAVRALGLELDVPIYFPKEHQINEIFQLTEMENPSGQFYHYSEPSFNYIKIPLTLNNLIIHGYFQSEKYFYDYKDIIRKDFTFRDETANINYQDSISLHVRRGDYVSKSDYHPLCTMEYYEEALALMPNEEVVVFSDDIPWCKEKYKGERFVFSEGRTNAQDLEYMSKCKHHIIANSSFSWWGAWLGTQEGVTVAPKKWLGNIQENTKDVVPEDWIVL